jgi:hypothetical protein
MYVGRGLGHFLPFMTTLASRLLTDFARTKFSHIRKPVWLAEKGDPLPLEEEAKRAVAALERIQALLVAVQRQANEQVRAKLSRGLKITMQQLVP